MIIWDEEKSRKLVRERGVSFDEMAEKIIRGDVLAVLDHPSHDRQRLFVIAHRGYTYCVPFVEDPGGDVILKTVYPSRKLHKRYGGRRI